MPARIEEIKILIAQ